MDYTQVLIDQLKQYAEQNPRTEAAKLMNKAVFEIEEFSEKLKHTCEDRSRVQRELDKLRKEQGKTGTE